MEALESGQQELAEALYEQVRCCWLAGNQQQYCHAFGHLGGD